MINSLSHTVQYVLTSEHNLGCISLDVCIIMNIFLYNHAIYIKNFEKVLKSSKKQFHLPMF